MYPAICLLQYTIITTEKLHWALLNQTPLYIQLAKKAGKVFSIPLKSKTLIRLNSVIQNEVRNLKKLSRITIPCFIVQLDFQIGNSEHLHKAKYARFSPTKKLLVLG